MSKLLRIASIPIMLAIPSLIGCAHAIKLAQPPAQEVIIERDKLTVDGVSRSMPSDTFYTFANGSLVPHPSGLSFEFLMGADVTGLEGSPWIGLRLFHVSFFGLDIGADKSNFTIGPDYLWHELLIGPNICIPYDLLQTNKFGAKIGIIF